MVVAVGLGSAVIGVVRGTLSARRRFTAVGTGLVAENGLRCVLAAGLALAGVDAPEVYGLVLVAGYLAALLWPSALLPARGRRRRRPRRAGLRDRRPPRASCSPRPRSPAGRCCSPRSAERRPR